MRGKRRTMGWSLVCDEVIPVVLTCFFSVNVRMSGDQDTRTLVRLVFLIHGLFEWRSSQYVIRLDVYAIRHTIPISTLSASPPMR